MDPRRVRELALLVFVGGCGSTSEEPAADSGTDGTTNVEQSQDPSAPGDTTDAANSTGVATSAGTSDGADSSEGSDDTAPPQEPCNGHVELCDRPYDQVVFPGTHNSHAALDDGFPIVNANHQQGIAQQLADGVRVMLIDIYPDPSDADQIVMCHGPCILASLPHLDGLNTIVDFLRENPREVLTIIYQDAAEVEEIAEDFAITTADTLTYAHEPGTPWPTLGEMIEADTRLVITAESGGPPPAWYHHVWDQAWDTPYGPSSIDDLSCDLNRGSPDHDLFLMNHWVNTLVGLPDMGGAAEVNSTDVLLTRAQECWKQWDHPPNFVVVDWYEQGDLFSVVDTLNGV